mgnify:CR=1 FL=1
MARKFKSMDGNEAAAYVSYAYTEVAGIYPITPSSPMADHVDQWAAQVARTSSAPRSRSSRWSPRQVQPVPFTVRWAPVL